jgi:hypothetical protein
LVISDICDSDIKLPHNPGNKTGTDTNINIS